LLKCHIEKSEEEFSRDNSRPSGRFPQCKDCVKVTNTVYTQREKPLPNPDELRECTKCHEPKPLIEFYKDSSRKDGYSLICKLCKCQKVQEYRHTHPEEVRNRKLAWKKTPAGIACDQRYRQSKYDIQINDLTGEQWEAIKAHYNYRCVYCSSNCKACKNKTHDLTRDHITPSSTGGNNTLWNIVPSCLSCNSKKHTSPPPKPIQPMLLSVAPPRTKRVLPRRARTHNPDMGSADTAP
jgi:hypothetical protein